MRSSKREALLWGVVGVSLVFALGAYGGRIAGGERGSFTMNFPATGAECGGPSPRDLTGQVTVSIDEGGVIKRTLQPNVVEVTAHVVRNVGDVPRTISFEASGFPETTEWHSRERAWNQATRAIERPVAPGEAVDISLLVTLPDPLPNKPVLMDGAILIRDTGTGERLSVLPVSIVRSGASSTGGECCE